MGTLADPATTPRFGLADRAWRLSRMQCQFTGGTGSAAMTLALDRGIGLSYLNRTLLVTASGDAQGTGGANGAFFNLRIPANEAHQWEFPAGSYIVPVWTNPDAGNMRWQWEVDLDAVE